MMLTMIVVAVRLYLREDELISMKIEDFKQEYFFVVEDDVKSLAAEVQGKNDDQPILFKIWDYDECPTLSACKAVLFWIHYSGIKSGYLFPMADDIGNSEHSNNHCTYEFVIDNMKRLCKNVLGIDTTLEKFRNLIIGTHILRKTAFVLACFGEPLEKIASGGFKGLRDTLQVSLLRDARHKSIDSSATYMSDSGTLREAVKEAGQDPPNQVGQYRPIRMDRVHNFTALNQYFSRFSKPIVELSRWYVVDVMKGGRWGFRDLHKWTEMHKPKKLSLETVKELLGNTLFAAVKDDIEKYVAGRVRRADTAAIAASQLQTANSEGATETEVVPATESFLQLSLPQPPTRRKNNNGLICLETSRR